MTITPSGIINLGGNATNSGYNLSIEEELYQGGQGYNSAGTSIISLNDSQARTLAGKSSGQISLSDFYGKSVASAHLPNPGGFIESDSSIGGANAGINLWFIMPSGVTDSSVTSTFGTVNAWDVWAELVVGANTGAYDNGEYSQILSYIGNINPIPTDQTKWSMEITGSTINFTRHGTGVFNVYNQDISPASGWVNLSSYNYVTFGISGSYSSAIVYVGGHATTQKRDTTYVGSNSMIFTANLALTSNTAQIISSQQYTIIANNEVSGTTQAYIP